VWWLAVGGTLYILVRGYASQAKSTGHKPNAVMKLVFMTRALLTIS